MACLKEASKLISLKNFLTWTPGIVESRQNVRLLQQPTPGVSFQSWFASASHSTLVVVVVIVVVVVVVIVVVVVVGVDVVVVVVAVVVIVVNVVVVQVPIELHWRDYNLIL